MEKEALKLDKNRRRVQSCPCGKSNRDGKFVPFKSHDKYGYCHSCGKSFFPESNKPIEQEFEIPKAASTIDRNLVSQCGRNFKDNNFTQWLKTIFDDDVIKEAISDYLIGTSNHWNGATVFWQIDKFERVRGGKIMLYNASNGKRVKEPYNHINWVHSVLKTPHFNLKQCLFGEHLLNVYPNKIVAIVEAEKTAFYMNLKCPEKLWLATGSKGNFKYELLKSLYGRTIIVYPDKSEYLLWNNVVVSLKESDFDIYIDDHIELTDLPDGSDLVDFYEAGFLIEQKEIISNSFITKTERHVMRLSEKNININDLIETFDLTDELGYKIRTFK